MERKPQNIHWPRSTRHIAFAHKVLESSQEFGEEVVQSAQRLKDELQAEGAWEDKSNELFPMYQCT